MADYPDPCPELAELTKKVADLLHLTSAVKAEYDAAVKRRDPLVGEFAAVLRKIRADGRAAVIALRAHTDEHGCSR